jgi:YVTN family beta-propeller protein
MPILLSLFMIWVVPGFSQTLKEKQIINLPGPVGKRFDYLKLDAENHRLFLAHLGADQVYVIDSISGQVLQTITGTPGVEGIEHVPELQKLYTSNWRDHSIGVVDLKTFKVIQKIPAEAKPDGSAYAKDFQKLYVSDELAKALIIVDVKTDQIVKTIRFQSETGMPQYDPIRKKIYINLQEKNIFAVIDPATDTIVDQLSVGHCQGNHGMALDPEHHLAFLGCEGSNTLSVFDFDQHIEIAQFTLPEGVDVVAYDPGLQRIYAACYSGAISVIQKKNDGHFIKLDDFKVQAKVHSLGVNIVSHQLYVPEQEENGQPVSKLVIYDSLENIRLLEKTSKFR